MMALLSELPLTILVEQKSKPCETREKSLEDYQAML